MIIILMTEMTRRLGERLLKLIINTLRTESLYYKKSCNEAQHHSPQRDVDIEVEPPDEVIIFHIITQCMSHIKSLY